MAQDSNGTVPHLQHDQDDEHALEPIVTPPSSGQEQQAMIPPSTHTTSSTTSSRSSYNSASSSLSPHRLLSSGNASHFLSTTTSSSPSSFPANNIVAQEINTIQALKRMSIEGASLVDIDVLFTSRGNHHQQRSRSSDDYPFSSRADRSSLYSSGSTTSGSSSSDSSSDEETANDDGDTNLQSQRQPHRGRRRHHNHYIPGSGRSKSAYSDSAIQLGDQGSRERAPSALSTNSLDQLWVPASMHPEVSPTEWQSFLDSHVSGFEKDRVTTEAGAAFSKSSFRSQSKAEALSRRKSRLSRQVRDVEQYHDGAEDLDRRRQSQNSVQLADLRFFDAQSDNLDLSTTSSSSTSSQTDGGSAESQVQHHPSSPPDSSTAEEFDKDDVPLVAATLGQSSLRRSVRTNSKKRERSNRSIGRQNHQYQHHHPEPDEIIVSDNTPATSQPAATSVATQETDKQQTPSDEPRLHPKPSLILNDLAPQLPEKFHKSKSADEILSRTQNELETRDNRSSSAGSSSSSGSSPIPSPEMQHGAPLPIEASKEAEVTMESRQTPPEPDTTPKPQGRRIKKPDLSINITAASSIPEGKVAVQGSPEKVLQPSSKSQQDSEVSSIQKRDQIKGENVQRISPPGQSPTISAAHPSSAPHSSPAPSSPKRPPMIRQKGSVTIPLSPQTPTSGVRKASLQDEDHATPHGRLFSKRSVSEGHLSRGNEANLANKEQLPETPTSGEGGKKKTSSSKWGWLFSATTSSSDSKRKGKDKDNKDTSTPDHLVASSSPTEPTSTTPTKSSSSSSSHRLASTLGQVSAEAARVASATLHRSSNNNSSHHSSSDGPQQQQHDSADNNAGESNDVSATAPAAASNKKDKSERSLRSVLAKKMPFGGNSSSSDKTSSSSDKKNEPTKATIPKTGGTPVQSESQVPVTNTASGSNRATQQQQHHPSGGNNNGIVNAATAAILEGGSRQQPYYYSRFPIHIERAIYRLSHLKLANPRRPLLQQVLLSNFMYWYLHLINQEQQHLQPLAMQQRQQHQQQQQQQQQQMYLLQQQQQEQQNASAAAAAASKQLQQAASIAVRNKITDGTQESTDISSSSMENANSTVSSSSSSSTSGESHTGSIGDIGSEQSPVKSLQSSPMLDVDLTSSPVLDEDTFDKALAQFDETLLLEAGNGEDQRPTQQQQHSSPSVAGLKIGNKENVEVRRDDNERNQMMTDGVVGISNKQQKMNANHHMGHSRREAISHQHHQQQAPRSRQQETVNRYGYGRPPQQQQRQQGTFHSGQLGGANPKQQRNPQSQTQPGYRDMQMQQHHQHQQQRQAQPHYRYGAVPGATGGGGVGRPSSPRLRQPQQQSPVMAPRKMQQQPLRPQSPQPPHHVQPPQMMRGNSGGGHHQHRPMYPQRVMRPASPHLDEGDISNNSNKHMRRAAAPPSSQQPLQGIGPMRHHQQAGGRQQQHYHMRGNPVMMQQHPHQHQHSQQHPQQQQQPMSYHSLDPRLETDPR